MAARPAGVHRPVTAAYPASTPSATAARACFHSCTQPPQPVTQSASQGVSQPASLTVNLQMSRHRCHGHISQPHPLLLPSCQSAKLRHKRHR